MKDIFDIDEKLIQDQKKVFRSFDLKQQLEIAISIHNHHGFDAMVDNHYFERDKKGKYAFQTKERAYEIVEALHVAIFGDRKYKSFDSYRNFRFQRENPKDKKCNNVT